MLSRGSMRASMTPMSGDEKGDLVDGDHFGVVVVMVVGSTGAMETPPAGNG